MIGDRLSSPVIELGGGLAVYVRAKIIGSLFGKYDNMLVLKLKPLATDGASKRKNNLPKGRWMVTFKYSAPDFGKWSVWVCFYKKKK
jgi:hypothetical protein